MKSRIWRHIENYHFNSIIIRNIIIVFLALLVTVGVIFGVLYYRTGSIIRSEVASVGQSSLAKVRDTVDYTFKNVDDFAVYISIQSAVQAYIRFGNYNDSTEQDIQTTLQPLINTINTGRVNLVNSVYIISQKSSTVISTSGVSSTDDPQIKTWYDAYLNSGGKPVILMSAPGTYPRVVSVIRPIYLYSVNGGCVIVNVNVRVFNSILNYNANDAQNEKVVIMDGTSNVIYSNDSGFNNDTVKNIYDPEDNMSDETVYKGQKYAVVQTGSNIYNMNYLSFIPLETYEQGLSSFAALVRNIVIVFLIAAFILALFLSVRMFRPLSDLIDVIDNPAAYGNGTRAKDEVRYAAGRILATIDKNQMLREELDSRLIALNKMEASALSAQINHHFLYNTLETIKWKAFETGADDGIIVLTTLLADLYKISSLTETHMVSIRDEIEHSKLYEEILKIRYDGKLTVNWNIGEDIQKYKIIYLSLQPLLENAYYHGIKPKRTMGVINIDGRMEEGGIIIEVSDDGVGIDSEKLKELNESLSHIEIGGTSHIGIRNVNARIKLVMGEKYGISLKSSKDGTTVVICIPVIE